MATIGSKLVTKEMQWNANMTEQENLGAALIAKPTKLVGKVDQLFSSMNYFSDNPLTAMLFGGSKSEVEITGTSWEWDMKGANTRPLVVMEDVEVSNTTPGKFTRTYQLKLDEPWLVPGDIMNPGTADKRYQSRVVDELRRHGDGFVYNMRMMSDDDALFVPKKHFSAGSEWVKLYSMYEEANEQRGSTQFSTPITLESRLSKFGKKYKITDYASTEVLSMAIPDSQGGWHRSWMKYAEVEYWQQWYKELERGAWYTRSTETVPGANGRPVRSGPGAQELLEDSHLHRMTHLTSRLMEDYLMDIYYSRMAPGVKGKRQVKGFSGEYGMLNFNRAVEDWMSRSGFIKNVEMFTRKDTSPLHANAIDAGYQFTKYSMANGITMELVHSPLYDDRTINLEMDEITGYPTESQRITFLDFKGDSSDTNIKYVGKKDSFAFTYVEGLYGPYGPKKGGSSAHGGSYYEIHVEKSAGMQITDVTKCGEMILSRN